METAALQQTQPSAPSALHATVSTPIEALAAELGASVARIERTVRLEVELGLAQIREQLEKSGRQAAEMTARVLAAEHALREMVRESLAGLPDVAALVAAEFDRREDAIAQRAAAMVLPPDPGVIAEAVGTEVKLQIPTIAQRAAELAPEPDVAAAVSDEFTRRYDGIVDTAAALAVTRLPNQGDIDGAIDTALSKRLPEISQQAPELPDIKAIVELAVGALVERRISDVAEWVDQAVAGAFATVRVPEDGKSADPEETASLVRNLVTSAVEALPKAPTEEEQRVLHDAIVHEVTQRVLVLLPPPEKGDSVTLEPPDVAAAVSAEFARREEGIIQVTTARVLQRLPEPPTLPDIPAMVEETVALAVSQLPKPEKGDRGPPGLLPQVTRWVDRVYYENEAVTHGGRLYQAQRDTGREPPHEDWLCIAFAEDGRSLRIRETYSPDINDYREHDIVGLNGCSFVARKDNPGPCPGPDWQLLSDRGKAGPRIPGIKGDPGPPGPPVLALTISDDAVLTAVNADGSKASVDMYPILKSLEQ